MTPQARTAHPHRSAFIGAVLFTIPGATVTAAARLIRLRTIAS